MKFVRTIMKKAVDNCKRISDNKETAKVWVRSFTNTDVLLYSQRDQRGIKYFHHLKTKEPVENDISFLANPYELEELLKGKEKEKKSKTKEKKTKTKEEKELEKLLKEKEKEKVWKFETKDRKHFVIDGDSGKEVEIFLFQGKFPLEKLPYLQMNDQDGFKDLLDEIIKASSKEVNSVEIGGYEVSLKAPIYLKRFNLMEDFPRFIFPLDYIDQLQKNIIWPKSTNNRMTQCSKGNELYIRIENEHKKNPYETIRQLFVLTEKETYSPKAKQLEEEIVHSFTINTEDFWKVLNGYPAAITDVYLYDDNGQLVVDPYDKGGEEVSMVEIEENIVALDDAEEVEVPGNGEEVEDDLIDVVEVEEVEQEQPIHRLTYNGNVKRTKVDRLALMALLSGYVGEQDIDILRYIEDEEESFALRIYDKYLYSIVITKKEPNYVKVQRKLDQHLVYEQTLTFLNE